MPNDAPSSRKPSPASREDRLAAALRANLSRRKQLARTRKERDEPITDVEPEPGDPPHNPK